MSVARWSLRLPRASAQLAERYVYYTVRSAVRRVEQRRWAHHPPPRARPWAGKPESDDQANDTSTHRIQPHDTSQPATSQDPQPGRNTQLATTLAQSDSSDLDSPVHIPFDPASVLPPDHPARALLANSSLVIQRQLEMMNVLLGFEQANRYIILSAHGQTLGYIAEQDHGLGSTMARQLFKTHRSFTTYIFDAREREVLRIHRPFAWVNSRIRIYDPVPEGGYDEAGVATEGNTALQGVSASSVGDQTAAAQVSPLKLDGMRMIGEAQQQWAPLRRKYNLATYRPLAPAASDDQQSISESGDQPTTTTTTNTTALTEAAAANQPPAAQATTAALSPFALRPTATATQTPTGPIVGSVTRNFGGFARELFTDTGVYALRMDAAAQSSVLETPDGQEVSRHERDATAMTLDQRAVMLATAVSIDFDYFSRHSGAAGGGVGGGFMPMMFWPMGGGAAAAEGGAAGAAGAGAGAAEAGTAVEGAVGAASRGVGGAGAGTTGAMEGGMAGAGTMAGYEAMQRGAYGSRGGEGSDAAGDGTAGVAGPGTGGGAQQYDDASPMTTDDGEPIFDPDNQFGQQQQQGQPGQRGDGQESWLGDEDGGDDWGGGGGGGDGGPPPGADSGGGGDGGGGGWADTLSDFFGGD
ncbi:hypothetical protein LTR36_004492 [Oleoguttula mirabilis]|uniref:Scramblase-domain-containing protein n=1 Tax=Oleoguttula mirabilis TaxID=1507867 RepID=A0AAV9JHG7_9PEZI|nr:hypothetical protein LTR36_004492 [Oleoguttula mirabilis]